MKQFVKSFQRVVPLFLLSDYTAQLHFTTGDLLFTLPKRSDTGLYSCEVVNEHGLDMASTKVIIQGKSDLSLLYTDTQNWNESHDSTTVFKLQLNYKSFQ